MGLLFKGLIALSCVVLLGLTIILARKKKDKDQVSKSSKKMAKQDDVQKQFNLAVMYDKGKEVEENKEYAFSLYQKAADQGYAEAQYRLGEMYDRGEGIEENKECAFSFYETAAKNGYVEAQHRLGVMYDTGEGVEKNKQQAFFWIQKAAEQGGMRAQVQLERLKCMASVRLIDLFKSIVPEVKTKVVEIVAIAYDPVKKYKVAVKTNDDHVNPMDACVGYAGVRIKSILKQLDGEKIDIVPWDDNLEQFVKNAIQPADTLAVLIDEPHGQIDIVVPENQLDHAIGEQGQNVRLASELTGWTLNVTTEDQIQQNHQRNFVVKKPDQSIQRASSQDSKKNESQSNSNSHNKLDKKNQEVVLSSQNKKPPRVNEAITGIEQVRLFDEGGGALGVVSISAALGAAKQRALDLVEVGPSANPPVCRILDYAKWLYHREKQSKKNNNKTKQPVSSLIQVRFRLKTKASDYNNKLKTIVHALKSGKKVEVILILRGREVQFHEEGIKFVNRVKSEVFSECVNGKLSLEQDTKLSSRGRITMVIASD